MNFVFKLEPISKHDFAYANIFLKKIKAKRLPVPSTLEKGYLNAIYGAGKEQ